jgi:hypothetical protein
MKFILQVLVQISLYFIDKFFSCFGNETTHELDC